MRKLIRWSAEANTAVKMQGARVVAEDGVRDYQGWGVLLIRKGSTWGTLGWFYGSCGLCDSYEDLSFADRVARMQESIRWHASESDARLAFDAGKGW